MENIDESKRKPRRTRGTSAYQYRNKFAFACIALGSVLFGAWAYMPIFREANRRVCDVVLHATEEEIDRKYLFNLPKPLPSREIQKHIDEDKEIISQR